MIDNIDTYFTKLKEAVEDYCDSCLYNDGLCKPFDPQNDCQHISEVKGHINNFEDISSGT